MQLPDPEPEPAAEYDTGSDAWWRAQAQAQRAAAHDEPAPVAPVAPAVPDVAAYDEPPQLVEPTVLLPEPSPLDKEWAPPSLPELHPAPAVTEEVTEEVTEAAGESPTEAAAEAATKSHLIAPIPETEPPPERPTELLAAPLPETSFDQPPFARDPYEAERVGPGRALAGAALALAGVALAIGALLLFGKDDSKGTPTVSLPPSPTAAATTAPSATPSPIATATPVVTPAVVAPTTTTAAPARVVPVSVLNNSKIKGLAERAAARFEAGGWPVPTKGNYRGGTIATTTVYFGPGQQGSAERFAKQFGIGRVAPRFPGLPTSGMTVIVTRDFA